MPEKESCESSVCTERFDNLKVANGKLELRVAELEKKTDRIDNNFVKLETKFDIYTTMTSEKFDGLARDNREGYHKLENKIDSVTKVLTNEMNKQADKNEEFGKWLKKFALKLIEYAVLVAIVLGVMYGIKFI